LLETSKTNNPPFCNHIEISHQVPHVKTLEHNNSEIQQSRIGDDGGFSERLVKLIQFPMTFFNFPPPDPLLVVIIRCLIPDFPPPSSVLDLDYLTMR
jgi:hypothetical protein